MEVRRRIDSLVNQADSESLPQLIIEQARQWVDGKFSVERMDRLVKQVRTRLNEEWSDPKTHLVLAPGTEVLEGVFSASVGT